MFFNWWILVSKVVKRYLQAWIALAPALLSEKIPWLSQAGIQISIDQALLVSALMGALEGARNWLKVKKGVRFL